MKNRDWLIILGAIAAIIFLPRIFSGGTPKDVTGSTSPQIPIKLEPSRREELIQQAD
jgi:hypothetical protein